MNEKLIQEKIATYKSFLDSGQEEASGGSLAERSEKIAYYRTLSKAKILAFTLDELKYFINNMWAKRLADDATEIFKSTEPETVKSALAEFIFGDGTIEERWDAMQIHKIGRGRKAEMLAFAHPDTCANCDSRDINQIMRFEPEIKKPRQGMTGAEYVSYCAVIEKIRAMLEEAGCPAANLVEADRFLFFLDTTDSVEIEDASADKTKKSKRKSHYLISCVPEKWDPSIEPIGSEETFTGQYKNCFENAKKGDAIVFYTNRNCVALGVVTKEWFDKRIGVRITEKLKNPVSLEQLKGNPETANCRYLKRPTWTTMSELTGREFEAILEMSSIESEISAEPKEEKKEIGEAMPYSDSDFLKDVYLSKEELTLLKNLLARKKNIILQGPPGVGKTYAARKLAYAFMKSADDERIKMVQFHQSYSYEDFIQGYKPTDQGGFTLQNGPFYLFCKKAAKQPDRPFFFIIDEVNRGNISKIFGELLMLIEASHRGEKEALPLVYEPEKDPFFVPENVYIIGLMNTADRSLALMDYALRRRFSFVSLRPAFETSNKEFERYKESLNWPLLNEVIALTIKLNEEIAADSSLGEDYKIGHSYFCGFDQPNDEELKAIVLFDIIPTIKEYWNDDEEKRNGWVSRLAGAVK